jgi:hypothetical protein
MARQISPRVREFRAELDRVTPALVARSLGRCEVGIIGICTRRATERHHRLPRSNPACTNHLTNLLHVCSRCHWYIETHRSEGYANGWLVKSGVDPADVGWISR